MECEPSLEGVALSVDGENGVVRVSSPDPSSNEVGNVLHRSEGDVRISECPDFVVSLVVNH